MMAAGRLPYAATPLGRLVNVEAVEAECRRRALLSVPNEPAPAA